MTDQRRAGYRLGTGPMPPPIDTVTREQWQTMCCIATDVGLCSNVAVDQSAAVKVCNIHTSIILNETLRRFERQIEIAEKMQNEGGTQDGNAGTT